MMRRRAFLLVLLLAPAAVQGQSTLFPSPHTATCYLDINGDGARSLDDPVFLQQACAGGTGAGDARLFAWDGFPGGTLIEGQHSDAGTSTAGVASTYAFFDGDGSGAYSSADDLFLALGAVPGPLRPGDLPLVGEDAFTSLRGDDPRVGRPLAATAVVVGGESYQERDGTVGYTTKDALFLDLDGSGTISIGDLRLAVPLEASTSTSSSGSPTPAPTPEPNGTSPAPSSPESPGPSTLPPPTGGEPDEAPGDEKGTPGPPGGLVAGLLVLLVALFRRRRAD